MPFPRSSGILLHPTCFPSRYGIGDLGLEAYQFVDFLARSAQRYWQILPLNPPSVGNSPYMCFSTMAGNHLLISLDVLQAQGLLEENDLKDVPEFPLDRVDFEKVIEWKTPLLRKAAQNFANHASPYLKKRFEGFCHGKARWLEDYALFMALLAAQGQPVWMQWPQDLRHRYEDALNHARYHLAEDIFFHKFVQFEFVEQWLALKRYANDLNVDIIGDIPIYVGQNSADVWANPAVFKLNHDTGEATEVAGVPPDYFSATGQLWGNPIYNWDHLQSTGFDWWVRRVEEILSYVDLIRIDHFRGLVAYWSVPAGETTAMNGTWVEAPGYALFDTIRDRLGKLPIIAEDLGDIDQPVLDMRDHYEFPGMKILHFAFGSGADNPYLPFNVDRNCIIYTGTHDNNTTVGWYTENASDYEKGRLSQYLGGISPDGVAWDLIRLAYGSVANQAIIPLQDAFSLGSDARMNVPSQLGDNWSWRYRKEALTEESSNRLRDWVHFYRRSPG